MSDRDRHSEQPDLPNVDTPGSAPPEVLAPEVPPAVPPKAPPQVPPKVPSNVLLEVPLDAQSHRSPHATPPSTPPPPTVQSTTPVQRLPGPSPGRPVAGKKRTTTHRQEAFEHAKSVKLAKDVSFVVCTIGIVKPRLACIQSNAPPLTPMKVAKRPHRHLTQRYLPSPEERTSPSPPPVPGPSKVCK